MKETKNYAALKEALNAGKLESNSQHNYLFKVLNSGKEAQVKELQELINNSEGVKLSTEQIEKGFSWLCGKWKSPTGKDRKNNPFGYREQAALENKGSIELYGYYNAGNRYRDYFIPLYDVYSKDGYGFQYYVSGGEIHIVG